MKYIITESQYKLLTEDLGVSRASIPFTNLIYNFVSKKVKSLFKTNQKIEETLKLTLKDIFPIYKSNLEDFIELPIEEIVIKFSFERLDDNPIPEGFQVLAFADMIDHGSYIKEPSKYLPKKFSDEIHMSLVAGFEFQFIMNKDFKEIDEMLYDFRDAVLHEFNHMYEYYNRAVKGEKELDTTLSFMKKPFEMFDTGLNEEVLSVWKQFLSILYMSEPYEVRAMSQEAYSKRLRMSFDEFKNTKYWQYAQGMKNFDANNYYDYILELIENLPQEEQDKLLETLHTYFIAYYEFSKKTAYNNPLNKKIMNTKNILDIMKYFQPTINKMGEKLRRNFIRLYSLNPE
jgi:hypothetical protein